MFQFRYCIYVGSQRIISCLRFAFLHKIHLKTLKKEASCSLFFFFPVILDFIILCRKLIKIVNNTDIIPTEGEKHLPVLTATDRPTWAEARTKYFSSGVNKESLDLIENVSSSLCAWELAFEEVNFLLFLRIGPMFYYAIKIFFSLIS